MVASRSWIDCRYRTACPTSAALPSPSRCIFVSNQLPLRPKAGGDRHEFEWDEDALIAQAKEGLPDDMEAVYVGCLPFEVDVEFQEVRGF